MPKTETKLKQVSPEELDLLPAVIGEMEPEDVTKNSGGYERWMSRFARFEVTFRTQRRGFDPATGDSMLLGGRKIKFIQGIAFLPKNDPDFQRMRTILKRTSDFVAGNVVCVDEKMAEGLIENVSDIEAKHINQGDEAPMMEMGIHPSMHKKIQKILDKRRRLSEAPLNQRLKELRAENERLKAANASAICGSEVKTPNADEKSGGSKAKGDKVSNDGNQGDHTDL